MAYQYPGISGRFAGGIANPAQNRMLSAGAGLRQPNRTTPAVGLEMRVGDQRMSPASPASAANGPVGPAQKPVWDWGTPAGMSQPTNTSHPAPYSLNQDQSRGPIGSDAGPGKYGPTTPEVADYVEGPEIPGFIGGPDPSSRNYYGYDSELWQPGQSDIPEAGVNTRDIVEARRWKLDEEMNAGMADAARRMGGLGMLKSSGYAGALGNEERKRDLGLADLFYQYDYNAAQSDANRKSTARENALSRSLSAHGAHQGRLAGEAARHTQFDERGYEYGVGQQDRENEFNRYNYGAGTEEALRRQRYEDMKARLGIGS